MADEKLTPADPCDLADAIAFALRFSGRRHVHQADEYMAKIAPPRKRSLSCPTPSGLRYRCRDR
jgi:hypothetical protein